MPEKHTPYQDRLTKLRQEIDKQGLDGFILPRTDAYQSEFLAPCAERLKWLTGFTGTAGTAIILPERAVVLSDGRYTLQLRQQINADLFETGNSIETPVGKWLALADQGEGDLVVGYDPHLYTPVQLEKIKEDLIGAHVRLQPVQENPVDVIWDDRPAPPTFPVELFPDHIAGRTCEEKRELIAQELRKTKACACILSLGDSICWMLNVRGGDVEYSPLVLSYAIVREDASVDWFVDEKKVPQNVRAHLGEAVRIFPPENMAEALQVFQGQTVWMDRKNTCAWFEEMLKESGATIFDGKDPCILPKALKTPQEQEAIRQAHVRDGVAVVRFLKWLQDQGPAACLSEMDVADKLESFRRLDPAYRGPSFGTIAGTGANGAVIHYRASAETNRVLDQDNLLLIDSGGQYLDEKIAGTTDITRTVSIGIPSEEMRINYTRVLKGHIAVSKAHFPVGTTGVQVDALARQPLWEADLDYAHGTGHGVGAYMCVHEEAASISPRGKNAFQPGMLISNEPGYYKEGSYGIRIENLVLVREAGMCESAGQPMMDFETVTLAPLDRDLIVADMMAREEKAWLNRYFEDLREMLCPLLGQEVRQWLMEQTEAY